MVIAVDMPIGFPERVGPVGRGPEREVRRLLGERQSSVFAVPSRAAVSEDDYRRSCDVALATSEPSKKVSKQCFHLFPKIREIDRLMTPGLEARVYEAHPELAFWRLNGERPMALPKKVKSRPYLPGIDERAALLVRHGYDRAFLDQKTPAWRRPRRPARRRRARPHRGADHSGRRPELPLGAGAGLEGPQDGDLGVSPRSEPLEVHDFPLRLLPEHMFEGSIHDIEIVVERSVAGLDGVLLPLVDGRRHFLCLDHVQLHARAPGDPFVDVSGELFSRTHLPRE